MKKTITTLEKPVLPQETEDQALKFAAGQAENTKAKDTPITRSGLVPEGHVRLNANIPKELHMRIKIEAAKQGRSIGDMIAEWIDKNTPKL